MSALRRVRQQGHHVATAAAIAVDEFDRLPIVQHGHQGLRRRAWALRDRFTVYDAVYVALAESLSAPLVTTDGRLARGARGLVEVIALT